ncbi:UPF0598 protein [Blattella germanica]|nr:UPF0598 protein [Blattella germanica]
MTSVMILLLKRGMSMCTKNFSWHNYYSTNALSLKYVQGQSPEPKIREYFYFIDHQGMLFLDDARMKNFTSCFKDTQFLEFFFKRIRVNTTGRYSEDFPYLSLCGRERNFIRCDDFPIVFTNVFSTREDDKVVNRLSYGRAGNALSVTFEPEHIFMLPSTGRVYHPAPAYAGSVGLIASKLADEMYKCFKFKDDGNPSHFTWDNMTYELDNKWYYKATNTTPES